MMSYPFCDDAIRDEAVNCIYCRSELLVSDEIRLALKAQGEQIAALRSEVDEFRIRGSATDKENRVEAAAPNARVVLSAVQQFTVSYAGLLVAYYTIVWLLDLDVLILRLASIAIPVLSTITYRNDRRPRLAIMIGTAAALGVFSVLTMSAITAWRQQIPWPPSNTQEAREVASYMCSIALSFMTGDLIARTSAWQRICTWTARIAAFFARLPEYIRKNGDSLETHLSIAAKVIQIGAPIVTAIGALITGVLSLSL